MFTLKKIKFSQDRQTLYTGLFLLFAMLFHGVSLSGQTRQARGTMSADGGAYNFGQTQHQNLLAEDWNPTTVVYYDFTIPQVGAMPYLKLTARGGDGGKIDIKDVLGHTARTGQGGQGALVHGIFKIGTGANELKPGSTLRVIIGQCGRSDQNNWGALGSFGGGGGGGTGILYLPAGGNENNASDWQILAVAGAGGGGSANTAGSATNGLPGEITEEGFINESMDNLFDIPDPGKNRNGGLQFEAGAGGGTALTWADLPKIEKNDYRGRYGFQEVNGVLLPIGGNGGYTSDKITNYGGYGFGGGGAAESYHLPYPGGGGGGYSGGFSGRSARNDGDGRLGGGGGGSYLNPAFLLPGTAEKIKNNTTSDPQNGYMEYQFLAANPVAYRDLGFTYANDTDYTLLNTGGWNLRWQHDGNLVLYQTGVGAKWASNTNTKGDHLYFQGDGNLVIRQNGAAIWASNTANAEKGGKGGRKLVLTSEGSLYIIDQDDKVIWRGH